MNHLAFLQALYLFYTMLTLVEHHDSFLKSSYTYYRKLWEKNQNMIMIPNTY